MSGKGGDSAALLALGAMVARAINDLAAARAGDSRPGYTRRTITYPGCSVVMMLCSDAEMADIFEAAALVAYNGVETKTPKSEVN